jgi:hypothetical protein
VDPENRKKEVLAVEEANGPSSDGGLLESNGANSKTPVPGMIALRGLAQMDRSLPHITNGNLHKMGKSVNR